MPSDLEIREVPGKGRGVFATRLFIRGAMIERAPVIVLAGEQYLLLNETTLGDYYFDWGESACAIPLGLSMLYNHSEQPNALVRRHIAAAIIDFIALRDIEPGEEITHRYACPIWFETIEQQ